ncbi:MAG: NUDIX domain-containing protein [Candidatus Spechtbacterales bacterium]
MTQPEQNIKVAVDIVIFTVRDNALKVILIQMKKKPFTGMWAFPGGLIDPRESLDEAARRELAEKTGVYNVYLEQLYTFGEPARDPYSRVISAAYFALIDSKNAKLATTEKYSDIGWFPVQKLPKLAYDHWNVVKYAIKRLQWKLAYTNIAYSLLPRSFAFSELRSVYETILGRSLDRRNFQRKIHSLRLLKKARGHKTGKHRPATLYEFKVRKLMIVEVL